MTLPSVTFSLHIATLDTNLRPLKKRYLRDEGQGLVEYATMLAIMLVLTLGLFRLIETNAFQVLVKVARSLQ